jgi:hypothetical protein
MAEGSAPLPAGPSIVGLGSDFGLALGLGLGLATGAGAATVAVRRELSDRSKTSVTSR